MLSGVLNPTAPCIAHTFHLVCASVASTRKLAGLSAQEREGADSTDADADAAEVRQAVSEMEQGQYLGRLASQEPSTDVDGIGDDVDAAAPAQLLSNTKGLMKARPSRGFYALVSAFQLPRQY